MVIGDLKFFASVEMSDMDLLKPTPTGRDIGNSCIEDSGNTRELVDNLIGGAVMVKLPAHRAMMFVINRADGRILAQYGDAVTKDAHIVSRPGIAA